MAYKCLSLCDFFIVQHFFKLCHICLVLFENLRGLHFHIGIIRHLGEILHQEINILLDSPDGSFQCRIVDSVDAFLRSRAVLRVQNLVHDLLAVREIGSGEAVQAPKRKDLFLREALLLKQSHSLCSSMTTEQERHEAAYMEAVRSTMVKITYGGSGGKTLSLKEINAQINELLKASIQSQGVISLFDSKKADENISLFDPAVLDEISKMKEKNIAVEILKKLMAEQVSLYKRTNVVQSQKFSEKITQLMNSYYNGLITNEEVIKELLKTAQEITELYNNGKKLGLTQEELAFYDALTKPENIKDFYQNNELIELTRELTEMLRKNRTIDWQKKETARASMRKMVKHLLKKYKYPPEDYDTAISTVISQCEMWTDNMVV